jgi:thiol:disulfide interchange protein DsbA
MQNKKSWVLLLVAALFLIVISAILTSLIIEKYIISNTQKSDQFAPITEMSADIVATSPVHDGNDVIEVLSYACHYCAAGEEAFAKIKTQLPPHRNMVQLHLSNDSFLGQYAPIFATLHTMNLEAKMRDKAYFSVITQQKDISTKENLKAWLHNNNINLVDYEKARNDPRTSDLQLYMKKVTQHYQLTATPAFIVAKRWIVYQDGNADALSETINQLLAKADKEAIKQ